MSLTHQKKRKHHKQPQFYLKGFAAKDSNYPETPSIWIYKRGEILPKLKGIKNTAFAKDFYAFVEEDGSINFNKYEDMFMKDFESPANPVIEKIRLFKDIDNEEKVKLYNYVASMVMRGDYWKQIGEYAETVNEPSVKSDIERDVSAIVSIAKKQGDKRFENKDELRNLFTDYIEKEKEKRKKGEYEKSLMVRFAKRFRDEILKKLEFKFFMSPKYMSFFTSDSPVCYTSFNNPNAQLIFPISSRICLVVYKQMYLTNSNWQRKSNQFWQIDIKTAVGIRDFVTRRAIKEIYYSQKAEWLVKFINNR